MTQSNMPNLPGFDAMADTLEFVKNMWGGVQATSGIPMPTLSLEDVNKQIADLKAVESWLNVNMNMLRGTIQALEVQSATITTLNAMGATFGAQMKPDAAAPGGASNTTSSASSADAFTQNTNPAADQNPLYVNAAADAATAWWSALQTQFNQAVSNVMADETSAKARNTAPAKPSAKSSATAAKTAVKKRSPAAKS
ncbi:PhaM family polyhydroxyalkanoate granule multifunctional regulatory protein [Herminiimonas fonticola]|uniref:Uncharacterized protein n=1 Tax=Herminiimonas fonticola TaxID=303380 RepID=A0A4R6GGU9_9BURK|nr:PhaM family polyhydroxyalkanoate granule multifunctional regulatory protein [Herminiimonas fonticola]RBA24998.1 hypothetical protein Hfont_0631 [Herminiimonas fonticola]TDN94113.1 hypothetical protein EV677_0654 [Herminiimonas fonticola]